MLTPYAITRAGTEAGEFSDCYGRTLRAVESFGLSLLVGDPIDAECDAEGFMDTVALIHEHACCVPVRLDDPLNDETAVRRLLETGADRFTRLLDRLTGADEWSVRVEAPIRDHAPPPAGTPPAADSASGRSYLRQRRRDLDTASGIHPEVSDLIAVLSHALAPLARDTRTLPAKHGAGSLALLVDRDRDITPSFRAAAADATLPCMLSGPWPPFSFVSLAT